MIHLDSHPASGHGDEVGRCLPQLLQTYEQHDKDSEEEWDPWETNLPVGITAQPKNSNVCGPFVWTMCGKIVAECARQENTTDVLSAISEWNVDSSDYAEIRTTSKAKVQALQRQYGTFEQRKNTSTRSRSSPSSSSGHRASPLSGSSWFPDSSLSSSSSTSSSSSSRHRLLAAVRPQHVLVAWWRRLAAARPRQRHLRQNRSGFPKLADRTSL